MRIGVDGNLLCGKRTGMGIVAASILKNIELDDAIITIFVPRNLDTELAEIFKEKKFEIVNCGSANYFKWEQLVLPKAVKKYNIDVLWCPYNTAPLAVKCATVVTVHDMIYMSLLLKDVPSLYKKAGMIYRRTIVPKAVKKASKIITISQFAKHEICGYFPSSQNKITVVYNSADINAEELNESDKTIFFDSNNIKTPYILGFGSLESRKNSMGLIKAYCKLPDRIKRQFQLVLFGFRGFEESEEYKYIQNNAVENVIVLGYVSEKEKNTLYKNSTVFVFPTFSEGFGIPVLEAFSNRTAVITSNVTSLPEVAGDAAVLVNPTDIEDIKNVIEKVLDDEKMRLALVEKGLIQLKNFDWKNSSKMVLNILQEVAQHV